MPKAFIKEINTPTVHLKMVTFRKFLEILPNELVSKEQIVNGLSVLRVRPFSSIQSSTNTNFDPSSNEPELVNIPVYHKPLLVAKSQILMMGLLDQAKLVDVSNDDLGELIIESAYENAYNYGNPTYLVNVGFRLWMVADIDDFVVINVEGGRFGFFCKSKERTVLYSIHKGKPKTFKILGQN